MPQARQRHDGARPTRRTSETAAERHVHHRRGGHAHLHRAASATRTTTCAATPTGDRPCTHVHRRHRLPLERHAAPPARLRARRAGATSTPTAPRRQLVRRVRPHVRAHGPQRAWPCPPTTPHTANPTLNGTCTVARPARSTCTGGVCDFNDNLCGYANGDGPCTHDERRHRMPLGTCAAPNGTCEPAGGCKRRRRLRRGQLVQLESTHVVRAHGRQRRWSVPTDPSAPADAQRHLATLAAGTLPARGGVCDTKDNLCGYANGGRALHPPPTATLLGRCAARAPALRPAPRRAATCVGLHRWTSQCSSAPTPHCNMTIRHLRPVRLDSTQCMGADARMRLDRPRPAWPATAAGGPPPTDPCPDGGPALLLHGQPDDRAECGVCTMDSRTCPSHGNVCDTTTGLCSRRLRQRLAVHLLPVGATTRPAARAPAWPSSPTASPLPGMPTGVSTCTSAVGTPCASTCRACASTGDNECGYAERRRALQQQRPVPRQHLRLDDDDLHDSPRAAPRPRAAAASASVLEHQQHLLREQQRRHRQLRHGLGLPVQPVLQQRQLRAAAPRRARLAQPAGAVPEPRLQRQRVQHGRRLGRASSAPASLGTLASSNAGGGGAGLAA